MTTLLKLLEKNPFRFTHKDQQRMQDYLMRVTGKANATVPSVVKENNALNVTIKFNELLEQWLYSRKAPNLKFDKAITRAESIEATALFERIIPLLSLKTKFGHNTSRPYMQLQEDAFGLYDKPIHWGNHDEHIGTNISVRVTYAKKPYTIEMVKRDVMYATSHICYAQHIGILLPRQDILYTEYIGDMDIFGSPSVSDWWDELETEAFGAIELYSLRLEDTY